MTPEWQPMLDTDLDAVVALSERIHPGLPEDHAIQARRLALWPQGCKVLRHEDRIMGYAFAHPIPAGQPPALNTAPTAIAPQADEFYLHDIVVDPALRGSGLAARVVALLLHEARGFATTALVSVYGTAPFWARFGFAPVSEDMSEKLEPYGDGAVFMRRENPAQTR